MEFIQQYSKELFALLVPLLTWLLNNYFKAKAKIQFAAPHRFIFVVNEPIKNEAGEIVQEKQTIHTISHVIMNSGKETGTNVELVFNWKPQFLNIWPSRSYQEHIAPDERFVMKFESLSPGEIIGLELLSINKELPNLVNVRSDQCTGTSIEMYPQPVVRPWQRRLATALILAGFSVAIYFSVLLLQFLLVGPV